MKEVEIKYRIKDRSSFYRLREYFLNHYADRIFLTENEEVRDHYYRSDDDISMRIRHLQRQDLYLRTIKGRSHIDERGFKVREESETPIDVPSAEELAKSYLVVRKQREGFHFNREKLYFDAVDGLGYFVELEYLVEEEKDAHPNDFILKLLSDYGIREDKSYRKLGEERFLVRRSKSPAAKRSK